MESSLVPNAWANKGKNYFGKDRMLCLPVKTCSLISSFRDVKQNKTFKETHLYRKQMSNYDYGKQLASVQQYYILNKGYDFFGLCWLLLA